MVKKGTDEEENGHQVEPPVYEGGASGYSTTPIWTAIQAAPKTFLEERSWLRVLMNFQSILTFLAVSLVLLVVKAFAIILVWDWTYAVQVASASLILLNAMPLGWNVLGVWHPFLPMLGNKTRTYPRL